MEKIVRYINENLTSDVSLNQLADRFFRAIPPVRMFAQLPLHATSSSAKRPDRAHVPRAESDHACRAGSTIIQLIRAFRENLASRRATTEMRPSTRCRLLTSVTLFRLRRDGRPCAKAERTGRPPGHRAIFACFTARNARICTILFSILCVN